MTDIFTVATQQATIEPWLLSNSVARLLSKRSEEKNMNKKELIADALKKYKQQYTWKTDWKEILEPIYQVTYESLPPEFVSLFSTKVNPITFSIIAQATLQDASVRLTAVWNELVLQKTLIKMR